MENPTISTVAELVDAHLRYAKPRIASSSCSVRKCILEGFAAAYGSVPLDQLKPLHLSNYVDSHDAWNTWTKHNACRNVKLLFNWAVDFEIINRNPFARVRYPKGQARAAMKPAEFQRLLRASWTRGTKPDHRRPTSAARLRQILLFVWRTGARPGEAYRLRWGDIDLDEGRIVLREHKTAKKTGQPRIIQLDSVSVRLLAWIRKLNQPGEFVFLNSQGSTWDRAALSRRLKRVLKQAGIPDGLTLYCARHGFATRAILNKVDLETLRRLMGHTNITQTAHYLHVADNREHMADAVEVVNGNQTSNARTETPSAVRATLPRRDSVAAPPWATLTIDV